jgi:hypothetical protein
MWLIVVGCVSHQGKEGGGVWLSVVGRRVASERPRPRLVVLGWEGRPVFVRVESVVFEWVGRILVFAWAVIAVFVWVDLVVFVWVDLAVFVWVDPSVSAWEGLVAFGIVGGASYAVFVGMIETIHWLGWDGCRRWGRSWVLGDRHSSVCLVPLETGLSSVV